jgi:hypothetical protein
MLIHVLSHLAALPAPAQHAQHAPGSPEARSGWQAGGGEPQGSAGLLGGAERESIFRDVVAHVAALSEVDRQQASRGRRAVLRCTDSLPSAAKQRPCMAP